MARACGSGPPPPVGYYEEPPDRDWPEEAIGGLTRRNGGTDLPNGRTGVEARSSRGPKLGGLTSRLTSECTGPRQSKLAGFFCCRMAGAFTFSGHGVRNASIGARSSYL